MLLPRYNNFFDGKSFEFNVYRGEIPNSTKDDDSGKEAGFFLIPIAPGIEDTEELRETYFNKIMDSESDPLMHEGGNVPQNDIIRINKNEP